MVSEIIVGGVYYRGPLPNASPNAPWKITVFRASSKKSTSGQPVGKSWQTYKSYPTETSALAALEDLRKRADATAAAEPEVVPPETSGALGPADEFAVRFAHMHQASERLHGYSILCAAMAGAVMLQRKAAVPGKFTAWKIATATAAGVSPRTADNYIALAKRCDREIRLLIERDPTSPIVQRLIGEFSHQLRKRGGGQQPPPAMSAVEMLSRLDPVDFTAAHDMAIAEAVRAVAPADTLKQLYLDWGIGGLGTGPRAGGDATLQAWLREQHPDLAGTRQAKLPAEIRAEFEAWREGRKPGDEEVLAAQRADAQAYWMRVRMDLLEFGGGADCTWGLLNDAALLAVQVALDQIARRMKTMLNQRGAR